ncbi:MAG TPA: hypothetical protein QF703_02645 [Candidatus Thalassarchaeaceae archaeon]|nr:hypothetical protein [Candidatus Thalassarchaeaceae archaeon]
MGVSPRSRWSNRDDRSYQGDSSNRSQNRKSKIHNWVGISGDFTVPYLIIGQFTSIAALIMLFSGTQSAGTVSSDSQWWLLNSSSLAVTASIGAASVLSLLLVIFSRSATRNRRRIARIWLIASIIAASMILRD